jgi:hypothetical protein
MAQRRTLVPHASAIAVAATTDMMRVFLWVMTSSWATMMASEVMVLLQPHNHRGVKLSETRGRSTEVRGAGGECSMQQRKRWRNRGRTGKDNL